MNEINRLGAIVSILFSTIFITILYFSPQFIGVYVPNLNNAMVIPIFNLEILIKYRIFFIAIFILSIAKEALKLILKSWNLRLAISCAVISAFSTTLTLVIFRNPDIWNPQFSSQIIKHTNLSFHFAELWVKLTTWFVVIIAGAGILEIFTAIYRGIKYNTIEEEEI